ncbi:MAG: SIR2 family protein [Prevotella sp.]|nr:SIR2 family protein [Prevotella sp.]
MQTTVFYGNGVNLLSKNGKTWDSILREISVGQILPPIGSNTLKYEYIVLPKDKYTEMDHGCTFTVAGVKVTEMIDTEEDIKTKLKDAMSHYEAPAFYDKLADLEADNYITTNYETFLNSPLIKRGYKIKHTECSIRNIEAHFTFVNGEKKIRLWNMHGSFEVEKDIMLGLYEYGESIHKLKCMFEPQKGKLNAEVEENSWPYIMLHSNVYILGFGLGYEEIDLWYFLTIRKRLIREKNIERNKIIYYSINDNSLDIGKAKLLEALDVEVETISFDWSERAYEKAYDKIYKRIKSEMQSAPKASSN